MHNKINQVKIGTVLSYVQMFINVVIGLGYSPIMIKCLGQSEYGLYNTVASTISMMSMLNLGLGASYIRYYSRYKKDDDREGIEKLNGLYLIVFSVIAMIALFCGLFISQNLEFVFDRGLSAEEYNIAEILMILLSINLAVSFVMSVFTHIIMANERFVILKALAMLKNIMGPLITIPLLLLGYNSVVMVCVTLGVSIFTDVCYLYYTLIKMKVRFKFGKVEKNLFSDLAFFSFFIAINLIIDQINWNLGKVILARYKGTVAVAIYSVGYNLYTYYQIFSTSISGMFTPRIHKIVNVTNNVVKLKWELTELFVRIGRIQYLVLGLIATGLIFFGKEFIFYWVGNGYEESYYVMLLLVLPASVPLIQNVGIEVQRAMNKHRFRSVAYLIMALINIIISIFLCQLFGAIGSAMGTAASLIVANGIIMNIYYHKKCSIDIILFWKNILRMSLGLIIPVISGLVINMISVGDGLWNLIVKIILYSEVYGISVWNISMNDYEKDLIRKPLRKVINKLR